MRPRRKKVVIALGLTLVGVGLMTASEGCRNATQVELVVTYSGACKDLAGVAFIVATDPYVAEGRIEPNVFTTSTVDCTPISPTLSRVGTLVVTPNDGTDKSSIMVMAGIGTTRVEDCKRSMGYFGCIVARRTFFFVPHTGLTLDIPLEAECLNVPCNAVSTCSHKSCIDSKVECDTGGCGQPGELLPDGGRKIVDAATSPEGYVAMNDGPAPPPIDAPADSPPDGASCVGSNQPVTCMIPSGTTKTCAAAEVCCYGAGVQSAGVQGAGASGAGADAGTDGAVVPVNGYDCRSSGACTPQSNEPNVNCRGQANCPAGNVCCYYGGGGMGTFCNPGKSCPNPMGAMFTQQICQDTCECPAGRTCSSNAAIMIGDAPAQTVKSCQ